MKKGTTTTTKKKLSKEQLEHLAEVRSARLRREAEELKARQLRYKQEVAEREAAKRAEEAALRKKAAELLQKQKVHEAKEAKEAKSKKRPSLAIATTATTAQPAPKRAKKLQPVAAVQLDDLEAEYNRTNTTTTKNPMVLKDDISTIATTRILYADARAGAGVWGDNQKKFAHPQNYEHIILDIQDLFNQKIPSVMSGEYNCVCTDLELINAQLPRFEDSDGNVIDQEDIVVRVTRPDAVERDDDDDDDEKKNKEEKTGRAVARGSGRGGRGGQRPFVPKTSKFIRWRYKDLVEASDELYYTLKAASEGFGVPIFAAFLFVGPRVRRKGKNVQLYGTCMFMHKAEETVLSLLDSHSKLLVSRGIYRGSPEHQAALRKGSAKVAVRVLKPFLQMAKTGVLYLDAKPSNVLVAASETAGQLANLFISDYDAGMTSDFHSTLEDDDDATETASSTTERSFIPYENWKELFFLSLVLFSVQVKTYAVEAITEGFMDVVKPLLRELLAATNTSWLFDARVTNTTFKAGQMVTTADATARLEELASSYFLDESRFLHMKCAIHLDPAPGADPLVAQLLKYLGV